MNSKPVKPKLHGIIDYLFSAILLTAPSLLGVNKKMHKTYGALGIAFFGMNALTDTPVGMKRAISFKGHQKADASFLAGLLLLTFADKNLDDKGLKAFHFTFLTLAISHYILTDYNAGSGRKASLELPAQNGMDHQSF